MRNWRLPLLVATAIFGASAAASAAETELSAESIWSRSPAATTALRPAYFLAEGRIFPARASGS